MKCLKIKRAALLLMIIAAIMFQSCSGPFKNIHRDNLMPLQKDLSVLNGTYQNISPDTGGSKMPLWSALTFDYKNLTPDKFPDSFYSVKFTAQDNQIEELKKFHKGQFDFQNIVNTANELKIMNELKILINSELTDPGAEFVKHFAKQAYPGMITAKVLEQFTNLTKRTIQNYINDLITERLKSAPNAGAVCTIPVPSSVVTKSPRITRKGCAPGVIS
jgi:hypothetical protein